MKILFIGPTRIGDTILSTSIINFYLKKYDDCSFSIITSPFARDIYTNMPRLSKILVVNKKKYGLHWLDIIKFSFFKKWDLVIDLRSSIKSYLLNERTRKIFRGNNNFHKIIQFKKFLNTDEELVPKVWYDSEVSSKSLLKIRNNERMIAVAPYSNWPKKDWSIKKSHFSNIGTICLRLPQSNKFMILRFGEFKKSSNSFLFRISFEIPVKIIV